MGYKCNIITPSIEKIAERLGKGAGVVCNAISVWQTENNSVEVPNDTQLTEILNRGDAITLAIPNYQTSPYIKGKLASSNKEGEITLFKWSKDHDLNFFFDYISGKENSESSIQKAKVFEELHKRGYTIDNIRNIITSKKLANAFLIYHEMSHIQNSDYSNYWTDYEGNSNRDLLHPKKIEIETRATIEALDKVTLLKNVLNNPKAKGKMDFDYKTSKRNDVTSNTTLEAIKNGERTATTRYSTSKSFKYWLDKNLKVGDLVEFTDEYNNSVIVVITKPLTKLDSNLNVEEWSKKEGWSVEYYNNRVKDKVDRGEAYQLEFQYVTTKSNNSRNTFVMHSGGAEGADSYWNKVAKTYGIRAENYRPYDINESNRTKAHIKVIKANKSLKRTYPLKPTATRDEKATAYANKLILRDWLQVKDADAVFAIGTLRENDVEGGTGWAVQMAIDEGKPVYVFNQKDNLWYEYNPELEAFAPLSETPILTPQFAGIGTSENLTEQGKEAIRSVFEATFGEKREIKETLTEEEKKNIVATLFDNTPISSSRRVVETNEDEVFNLDDTPKVGDILKVDLENPYAKLRRDFSPIEREDRVNLIARMFTDQVTSLLEEAIDNSSNDLSNASTQEEKLEILNQLKILNDPIKGRQFIIEKTSLSSIIDNIREEIQDYANTSIEDYVSDYGEEVGQHMYASYNKMLDNFDALIEEACFIIEGNENLRIILEKIEQPTGESKLGGVINESINDTDQEEKDFNDDENGNRADGNGGWSFKVRMVSPYHSISKDVKRVLTKIRKQDYSGKLETDDLGHPRYLNAEYVHGVLINSLSSMIEPSDFVITENGEIELPALENLKTKYPWVGQIIKELKNKPELISAFYADFRKDFIPYTSYVYSESDEKFVFKNLNEALALEGTRNQVLSNYEMGTVLDSDSIYSSGGNLNTDKANIGISIADEILTNLKEVEDSDIEDIAKKTNKVLRMIGFNTNISNTTLLLTNNDGIINTEKAVKAAKEILSGVSTLTEGAHLIDSYDNAYNTIVELIGEVSELDNIQSFRQGEDSYYSYSAPNCVDTMVKYLKLEDDERRNAYIENEFKQYDWFFDSKTREYRNTLLELLATDENVRWNLQIQDMNIIEVLGEEGLKKYENWNANDIATAFIRKFFSIPRNPGSKIQYAYYNFPIFADSPIVKFIKLPKYTGTNFKQEIIKHLNKVVRQELSRIKLVQERREIDSILPINNLDSKGDKFHFFPELNVYTVDENGTTFIQAITEARKNEDVKKIDELINSAIENIMNSHFSEFIRKDYIINNENLIQGLIEEGIISNKKETAEVLEEFFWNHTFMTSQIIQLTTTDLAFYKDSVDFQKRYKEVYAAGTKLNTKSTYGKEKQRTLYLKDSLITSTSYTSVKKSVNTALKESRISSMDRDSILYKFKDVNVTDAQALRNVESMRSILDMIGQWTPEMQAALERFEEGSWDMSDFNLVWQTIKPFVFTHIPKPDGKGGFIKVPHQNKNSEYLLLSAFALVAGETGKSPKLRAIDKFMRNHNIDVVEFESAVKVGGQGAIDLSYSSTKLKQWLISNVKSTKLLEKTLGKEILNAKDFKEANDILLEEGKIPQEEYNNRFESIELDEEETLKILEEAIHNPDGSENMQVIHEIPYKDYIIQQPTPEHLFDVEAVFGSQFRNLIIADLPDNFSITINGIEYKKKDLVQLYQNLIVENLLEDFIRTRKNFDNIEALQQDLLAQVKGNPKYSKDILSALEIVEITDPITGNKSKTFNVPLHSPTITAKIQELITSKFKNSITKQYIKGGACILVSNYGLTDELQVLHNEDGSIKGAECFLPAYSKKFYEPFLKTSEDGTYSYLDIEEMPEDLRKIIGYRIPTEDKYSMMPLIIKGFLPQQNGSSIMLPADITTIAGSDFDVDKMFLMIPEFNMEPIYDIKSAWVDFYKTNSLGITKETDSTIKKEAFGEWFKTRKETYDTGKRKPVKVKYNPNKTIEEQSRRARNNMIIDIAYAILTHKDTAEKIHNPGNFDQAKRGARITTILTDKTLLENFTKVYNIQDRNNIYKVLHSLSLSELDTFLNNYKYQRSPLLFDTFIYNHKQNMTGGALIGMYANNTTMQAKYQFLDIGIRDNFTFYVNGRLIKSVTDVTSGLGERISKNCANFSAASVDNVKDPVLADLMQNTKTAKIAALLLRAGLSIEEISLFVNQPSLKYIYETYGEFKSTILNEIKSNNLEYLVNNLDASYPEFDILDIDSEIMALSLINQHYLEELNDKEKRDFIINDIKAIDLMLNILKIANDLSALTQISRADSPNGAIDISLAGAKVQVKKVEKYHKNSENDSFTLYGIDNVITNDYISTNMDTVEIRERLRKSPMPMLQAFYSLGIDTPRQIVSPYFTQCSPYMESLVEEVFINSPKGIVESNIVNALYNEAVTFALTNTRLLGDDNSKTEEDPFATYEGKRNWYKHTFPKMFKAIIANNKDIASLNVIKKMSVNNRGEIIMNRSGRLTPTIRETLMRDFDQLLYMDNPMAQELAVHLFRYSFYKDGLRFGPNSYGNFFSSNFLNAFPEFMDALRTMKYQMREGSFFDRYLPQFYANHSNEKNLFKEVSNKSIEKQEDGSIIVETSQVINYNIDEHPAYNIITISQRNLMDDTIIYTPYILDEERSSSEYSTYIPMQIVRDRFGVRYNANKDVTELLPVKEDDTSELPSVSSPKVDEELVAEGLSASTIDNDDPADLISEIGELFGSKSSKNYSEEGGESRLNEKLCKKK